MNDTERAVLDMIRRYSVKYGAAHLKHETIEKAIKKSNATVRRAIRKLEKLGIIERIHYIRPVMSGLGANIYVIKPSSDQSKMNSREDADKALPVRQADKPQNEPFLSKSITTKDLKRTSPAEQFSYNTFRENEITSFFNDRRNSLGTKVFRRLSSTVHCKC